jgi:hypothetical protein
MAKPEKYKVSKHAEQEIVRRTIPRAWVDALLDAPEQRFAQSERAEILQSRFAAEGGKIYLVRAVVATDRQPALVITVYRTSKIDKYWRPE